ncbi:hypothetical protein PG991_000454 [Apiospora marii]|uniref:Uncharacterized protein n=1 Tax=Apiospora marii TaxID=335849 RepID=A0ABR1T257_9PEZI
MAYLIRIPRKVRAAAARSKIPSMARSALAFHPPSASSSSPTRTANDPRRPVITRKSGATSLRWLLRNQNRDLAPLPHVYDAPGV